MRSSAVRKFLFALIVSTLVAPNLGNAKAKGLDDEAQGGLDLPIPGCLSHLYFPNPEHDQRIDLIEAYHRFRIGRQRDFGGFLFETTTPADDASVVELNLDHWRESLWKTEKWIAPNQELRFINIGFRNLEVESAIINRLFASHLQKSPGHSLKLNFPPGRRIRERTLIDLRWHVHDAVMETYAERKKYLSPVDLEQLISYNSESSNNDVFALMSPASKPMEQMSYDELRRELLMTIQISYFGTRNYLTPSLRGVLIAGGYDFYEGDDRLPFEYRIPGAKLKEFRDRFYDRFNRYTTCEMNRYVKFGQIESAMQDRFLLKAIIAAKENGMKTIVASTDRLTARLFKNYGFKIFDELPPKVEVSQRSRKTDDEREFLLYLEVDSPEYRNFRSRLEASSKDVKAELVAQ